MSIDLVHGDGLGWLESRVPRSVHAIVTDPPYGLREYGAGNVDKLRGGRGGPWRQPPQQGGARRQPVPRFTDLRPRDIADMRRFLERLAVLAERVMVPGAHAMVASSPLFSHFVAAAFCNAGFEKRGEIVRLVQTLRGGDRPKDAHEEFADVTVMPRSAWEPWVLLRKPCEGRVQDNLRKWGTGGLRRQGAERPFVDVIKSAPTRPAERMLSPHPSLKPQAFMRQLVRAALPLGRGVIVDPFMGGGATVAAAAAVGYDCIGIELDDVFHAMAVAGVPLLQQLVVANA